MSKTLKKKYCLFMDSGKYNRNIACKLHDNAYGINGGGGRKERITADKALFNHMKSNNDPLAIITYMGIRFYGWIFFNYHSEQHLWTGQLAKRICSKCFE